MDIFKTTLKLLKDNQTIIRETKNGFFFYRCLDESQRGKCKIDGKVEYKTGYKYEAYVSHQDIPFFDEDEKEFLLIDLGLKHL